MQNTLIYLVVSLVRAILSTVMISMLIRSILSLFMMTENKFSALVFYITEPFVIPVRLLMEKLNLFQGTPIDFSFMITVILLGLLSTFL